VKLDGASYWAKSTDSVRFNERSQ